LKVDASTLPLSKLLPELKAIISNSNAEDICSFTATDPDIATGKYAGETIEIGGKRVLHRSWHSWTTLAGILGCRMLTPERIDSYTVLIRFQKLAGDSFHNEYRLEKEEKYGKDSVFNDPMDRFAITHNEMDHGAYKAPTLRNVVFTAPYMHDGRFKTLEDVIDMYSEKLINTPYVNPLMHHVEAGGVHLTPKEKEDLLNFIKTLSDEDFISNPDFSKPAKFPDEK